ncbi:MAG: hypothetical protein LLG93_02105 [Deltaproteobacteria bacterium]|nr:hypothetical protein [Deltaproteobacteria bacterium]
MMKRIWMVTLCITALLTFASTALAYKVKIIVDGPAIAPNCTEMSVEFIVEDNSKFGAKFWPQFDGQGQMTGVIANYWGYNYPVTSEAPSASFTVKDLTKGLKKIKAKTCYDRELGKEFGDSKDDQIVGIRKDKIEKL